MKITKLIEVFEELLPFYKQAYEENWNWNRIDNAGLEDGICLAALRICGIDVYDSISRYYKNIFKNNGYLFPRPQTSAGLKTRIEFMESEIKDLKRLLKKGYTHV